MSALGEAIDAAIRREATWERADAARELLAGAIGAYGSSLGSVRAAVRDSLRGRAPLTHDDVTSLSSELWSQPVYERRRAAIVVLQTHVQLLDNGDLTRLEGFVRTAIVPELLDPLVAEVITPMVLALGEPARSRADAVLRRWAQDPDAALRSASGRVAHPRGRVH